MLNSVHELTPNKKVLDFVTTNKIKAIVPPNGFAYAVSPTSISEKINLEKLLELLKEELPDFQGLKKIDEAQYASKIQILKPALSNQKKKETSSNLVLELIQSAAASGASDIHIKVTAQITTVRFRVDGTLRKHGEYSAAVGNDLLTVMYNVEVGRMLTTDEALDNTFYINTKLGRYMCRLNLIRTKGGDEGDSENAILPRKVVIRISRTDEVPNISSAGYTPIQQLRTKEMMYSAQGLLIISGAVNSGKTTSLLGLIQDIGPEQSILDISESVEIQLPNVDHVELPNAGDNLEERRNTVIKSSVRQDSDYLMIGEVRDQRTANIASYMALQGKFVFTTAHSTDAIACFRRLISEDDFGISLDKVMSPRFMVGIINQSLIAGLCPNCCHEEFQGTGHKELDSSILSKLNYGFGQYSRHLRYRNSNGCSHCKNTGIQGRQLVAEMLPFDDEVKDLLRTGKYREIVQYQVDNGYETKHTHAMKKCLSGLIDPTDVIKRISAFNGHNSGGVWGDNEGLKKLFADRSDNVVTALKRESDRRNSGAMA